LAARIYSLAKELNIDSKLLVDICAKAGLPGKGSALASLSDEEVAKLKAYLAGGTRSSAAASAAAAPVRPAVVQDRPIHEIPRPSSSNTATATAPPAPAPPVAPPPVEAPPQVAATAATPPPAAPTRPAPTRPTPSRPVVSNEPPPMSRESYISPMGTGRPPLVVPRRDKSAGDKKAGGEGGKSAERERPAAPAIRFGRMPTPAAPPPVAKSNEPEPQKPDIKLPLDAIRARQKGGTKPLEELVKKHEEKRKTAVARGKDGGREEPGTARPAAGGSTSRPPLTLGGRDRNKRGKTGVGAVAEGGPDQNAGQRDQRTIGRKRVGTRRRRPDEEHDGRHRSATIRRTGANTSAPRKNNVVVELPCTVRSFSEAVGVPANRVLGQLLKLGSMATINSTLDIEMAELLAVEMGVEVDFKKPVDQEEQLAEKLGQDDDDEALVPRPPIVTFLGHVDHGKTSLLDKIIGINVVKGESGGITQHIRAYRIEKDGRPIAFVDTPGHEAFTEMRARGAQVTDIAVLVVAADDGVMPQTEEAISHARAAGVPIVVALNKIDLPGYDENRIFQQLATNDLLPTTWGGDTEVVKTSATKGTGMDELLETLLTVAELHEYKANPNRAAFGTCIEAEQSEERGVMAKIIVQTGTLKVGDVIVCGPASGRVKAMYDTLDPRKTYETAGPSTPVNVTGLDMPPGAGDHFYALDDIAQAREIATKRSEVQRQQALGAGVGEHVTLENLAERLGRNEVQTLNLILRADTRGSIEAIRKELTKLHHEEVQIKILQATIGGISEADVHLAHASNAVIMGFNVVPDERARSLADEYKVQVRRYDIIYKVTEDLKAALEGMLKPEQREVDLGRALVQRVYVISRIGAIAGCRVLSGTIERNARIRVIRDNRIIGDYRLDSLKREKDDAKEVREGLECGMKLAGFNDLKEGDVLEAYRVEEVARTL
jgi:translation initiation factor IF-2